MWKVPFPQILSSIAQAKHFDKIQQYFVIIYCSSPPHHRVEGEVHCTVIGGSRPLRNQNPIMSIFWLIVDSHFRQKVNVIPCFTFLLVNLQKMRPFYLVDQDMNCKPICSNCKSLLAFYQEVQSPKTPKKKQSYTIVKVLVKVNKKKIN